VEPAQIINNLCFYLFFTHFFIKKFKALQLVQKNFTLTSKYLTFASELRGSPIGGFPALKTEVIACLVSAYLNSFLYWLLP
jgi:hypothetical protein